MRLQQVEGSLPTAGNRQFSHPVRLTPKEWTRVLTSIRVQKLQPQFLMGETRGPVEEVFSSQDIGFLSDALSQAFAQAQPEEIVVFGVSRARTPELTEVSTGGMFVEGATLHVVLANHRYSVTMAADKELLWDHPLYPRLVSYDFVPGPYQTAVPQGDTPLKPSPLELSIAFTDLLTGEPSAVSAGPDQGAPAPSPRDLDRRPSPDRSLEERLETLKRLKDRDLITEEDYREKRKQLLDTL